ncbi:hypothetical protein R83H12_01433 [Fibrobacteria bacterium R8-3-H12]
MKLLFFALSAIILSCADYPELDLSIKYGDGIEDARDNKKYKTVIIGKQEWMAENLNYEGEKGDSIGLCYNEETKNCVKFGRLYTWIEAMDTKDTLYNSTFFYHTNSVVKYNGICPGGWHIPSSDEWIELLSYVGTYNAIKLKSKSDWKYQATDEYGFLALPGGYHLTKDKDNKHRPRMINICGAWWSSSEKGIIPDQVQGLIICDDADSVVPEPFDKPSWASVRCVKD